MARSGGVGGAATLSSFRVQKAFSINFRENKRLVAEVKLIENEHIRNIRQVKQEIKDTLIWLDRVRESTGESQHGLKPDSETNQNKKKRRKIPPRSKTADPIKAIRESVNFSETSGDEDDDVTKYSEQESVTHVRFKKDDVAAASSTAKIAPVLRPLTEANVPSSGFGQRSEQHHRADLKSEPAISNIKDNSNVVDAAVGEVDENNADKRKNRVHSATSVRSSLASLTTYQRRHKLQSMMVKKQNPLEFKRQMVAKECSRVNGKVAKYLEGLSERLTIPMPDLSLWNIDDARHDTPFAADVNIAS